MSNSLVWPQPEPFWDKGTSSSRTADSSLRTLVLLEIYETALFVAC